MKIHVYLCRNYVNIKRSSMLKRKVIKYLTDWKKRQGHKPLVIDGARQVGKTRSVIEFGKNNCKNLVSD